MSKKQRELEQQNQAQAENVETKKIDKNSKEKDKKKDKKKKEKTGGIGKKTKETMSELKKVTWPSFGEVVKKTGVVIAFVVLFGLLFFGINALLGWIASLLAV